MKRILSFIALCGFTSLCLSATNITITPDVISSSSPAPKVCVSGFKPNSILIVMLPSFSYGFIINDRGTFCHTPNYQLELTPGTYDVPSIICNYEAGAVPSKCKNGPSSKLVVQ